MSQFPTFAFNSSKKFCTITRSPSIDRGHAAGLQLVLDGVAVGEGHLETVENLLHFVFNSLATTLLYGPRRYSATLRWHS